MSKQINIPDIGGDEVTVTEVLVKAGDQVTVDQTVINVEGDKASIEVPSPENGTIQEVLVKVGDKVTTGTPMFVLVADGASPAPAEAPEQASVKTEEVKQEAPKVETEPTTAPVASSINAVEEAKSFAHATPVVRRLAREFDVNLDKLTGTGDKNRITKQDVVNFIKNAVNQSQTGQNSGAGLGLLPWPKVDFSKFGEVEEVELTRINKISGANLHRNWVIIPHVTQFEQADITDLEEFRKEQNKLAEKQKLDVKLTPVVFLMKAAAKALEAFPRFNSSISEDGQRLTLKKYINIGVAVDTPNGLVVPVFKDVNKKGLIELSRELVEVSQKARAGKLTASDMQGGCFTISSLGGIGTTGFTPIVNAPEVAILGVSKSQMQPIWNGKEFTPRLMLPLSLSFDHRVIDGADGARFVGFISAVLSDIRRLAM